MGPLDPHQHSPAKRKNKGPFQGNASQHPGPTWSQGNVSQHLGPTCSFVQAHCPLNRPKPALSGHRTQVRRQRTFLDGSAQVLVILRRQGTARASQAGPFHDATSSETCVSVDVGSDANVNGPDTFDGDLSSPSRLPGRCVSAAGAAAAHRCCDAATPGEAHRIRPMVLMTGVEPLEQLAPLVPLPTPSSCSPSAT